MGKRSRQKTAPPPATRPAAPAGFEWRAHSTRLVLGLILAWTVGLGLACVLEFRRSPFFGLPIIDEEAYVGWGRRIAGGELLGHGVFYQDPLYPYLLGLVFWLFGENFLLVRLLQVAMGSLSVLAVYAAGRRLFGAKPALAAAAVLALYRGMYFFELQILKESLVILLAAVSCWLGVEASAQPARRRWWLGVGLSAGLLTLVRGNFQPILPLIALWALVLAWPARGLERWLRPGLVVLGMAAVLLPVAGRNRAEGGEWVLTTSQAGANFYLGNNPLADGRYATLPFVRANPEFEAHDFQAEAEKRAGRPLSPSEVSRFWFGEAFAWIKANPGKALKLLGHKARLMIHQYEVPDNHSFYLTRDLFVPGLHAALLGFGWLWGPALLGLAVTVRRDRRAIYPALFALLYAGSIIPFFIVDRYRLAVAPALALFSAGFGVWAADAWRQAQWRPLAGAAGWLAVALALGLAPTRESKTPVAVEYYLLANAYLKTGNPAEAVRWYDQAIPRMTKPDDAIRNRAEALRRQHAPDLESLVREANAPGRTAEELLELGRRAEQLGQAGLAVACYEKALGHDPQQFSAHARLGLLYATDPGAKDPAKALAHLQAALSLRPDDLDTMNALGNTYFLANNPQEAERLWRAVLAKNPAHAGAAANLEKVRGR